MIKINLLPPNIYESRTIKRLMALFVVILLVIVAGGVGYTMKLKKDTAAMKQQADYVEQLTKQADSLKSQAQQTRSSIAPMTDRIKFFNAVMDYNKVYPEIYHELARFTYAKVIYSQISPAAGSLSIQAYTPSLSDAGRYLLNLYKATHLFTTVSISAVPGYPQEGSQGGQPGFGPGMPGMPPGMGGPPMPGMPPMPGGAGMPDMMGAPMPGTGFGGLDAITSGLDRATATRKKGFPITVSCTLKNQIAVPAPPGAAAAAGGAGMPGGMPGMGGPPMPGGPAPGPPSGAGPGDSGGGGE